MISPGRNNACLWQNLPHTVGFVGIVVPRLPATAESLAILDHSSRHIAQQGLESVLKELKRLGGGPSPRMVAGIVATNDEAQRPVPQSLREAYGIIQIDAFSAASSPGDL